MAASAAAATATIPSDSIMIRVILPSGGLLGTTKEYTARVTRAGDNLVITGITSGSVMTFGPREIIIEPTLDPSIKSEIAKISKDGVIRAKIIACKGTDSETKHGCVSSVTDFIQWCRRNGIGEIRRFTAEERNAMISDEAKAMVLRGMMPQVPTHDPSVPTIPQLEDHLRSIGVTPLGSSTRRGGRKTHKKMSHSRMTHRSRRTHRSHRTRYHSTRRHRRTQRKH